VALVGETGEALERIVDQVAEVNGVVSEIAASAQEQASGLAQVNTAVNQMDQVTQQNAAMVEQATAASHTLAREADELSHLMARFELGAPMAAVETLRPTPRRPAAAPVAALKTLGQRAAPAAVRRPAVQEEEGWDEF
jgi:methyl-accepting chemotaxis protein